MDPYTLLIVTRSQFLVKSLRNSLDADQFLIRWVPSTSHALKLDLRPALLILDLPPSGGARSASRLKQHFGAPLLAVVRGVQPIPEHVDVHIVSPYRESEVVDLIETTLIDHAPNMIRTSGMSLDTALRRLQINGTVYQLRPLSGKILSVLMAHAGKVVSREELLRQVWHIEAGDDTRALDVHIAQLRRQLEVDPRHPKLILTERGIGYRLFPPAHKN